MNDTDMLRHADIDMTRLINTDERLAYLKFNEAPDGASLEQRVKLPAHSWRTPASAYGLSGAKEKAHA